MDSETLKRFESKYAISEIVNPRCGTPCWLWHGATRNGGYGYLNVPKEPGGSIREGRKISAHILMYEHVKGPIPEGLELDHLCRVKNCVNPDHLEAVTHAENVRRGEAGLHNPVKECCPKGHPYTPENTQIIKDPRGDYRRCKQCHAEYERERRNKKTIEVWCEYCQKNHKLLESTYKSNVRRNGKYRCQAYSTHLQMKKRNQ